MGTGFSYFHWRRTALGAFCLVFQLYCASTPQMVQVRRFTDGERRYPSTELTFNFGAVHDCSTIPQIASPGYGLKNPILPSEIAGLKCRTFSNAYSIFTINWESRFFAQWTTDVTFFVALGSRKSGYILGSENPEVEWSAKGVTIKLFDRPFERMQEDDQRGIVRFGQCIDESCPWSVEWHYAARPPELHTVEYGEHSYFYDFLGPCLRF